MNGRPQATGRALPGDPRGAAYDSPVPPGPRRRGGGGRDPRDALLPGAAAPRGARGVLPRPGYRFERGRDGGEAALAGSFSVFKQGHRHRWGATINGQVGGRPFTLFDYTYVTGGGNSNNRHRLTLMLWDAPEGNLPRFSLVPEGFFNRLAQRFGTQDFDFEKMRSADAPTSCRATTSEGPGAVHPARRAFLIAESPDGRRAPRHHLAGAGTGLWWRDGRLPGPDDLDQLIADGDR